MSGSEQKNRGKEHTPQTETCPPSLFGQWEAGERTSEAASFGIKTEPKHLSAELETGGERDGKSGIRIRGLCKSYEVSGSRLSVLRGVDLFLPEGKMTVLLGKSGCGKTTLLRLAGGLETPDCGEISGISEKKTAFIFQEPRLMPWLTVFQNAVFGRKRKEVRTEDAEQVLETVGLSGFSGAYPAQLSGGMQQRAALARALLYEPGLILADEPFAALDYFTREQMQKEIVRIQNERHSTILFVTHSIDEALLLGHKIVVLEGGRVKKTVCIPEPQGERDLLDETMIARKRALIETI